MKKTTTVHANAIAKLMLHTTASYISMYAKDYADDVNDIDTVSMYADDVAYNIAALQVFMQNNDAQMLHTSIMRQDTIVREHYIATLQYIENNNLIAAHKFCCS